MQFYQVKSRRLWGDYGRVLVNGIVLKGETDDAPVRIARTGPFVPPISFPSENIVVVNEWLRGRLAELGLAPLGFQAVEAAHIVEVHWETWNRDGDLPERSNGDPEEYLFQRPHSPSAAAAIGKLWRVRLRSTNVDFVDEVPHSDWLTHMRIEENAWNGDHLFSARRFGEYLGPVLVSDVGRKYLEEFAGDWLSFEPVVTEVPIQKIYYSRDRQGIVEAEPSLDRMKEIIATVDLPIANFGNGYVELIHKAGWQLTLFGRRELTVLLDCVGNVERSMHDCSFDKCFWLWERLADGDIDAVLREPWDVGDG